MSRTPHKPHQHALRRGRYSQSRSRYFVTFCTEANSKSLATPLTHDALQETIKSMSTDGTLSECSHCLMPDHVHLFFRLGERLPLARTIARLKSKTKQLASTNPPTWQSGYYDHKLRKDEDLYPIIHYIYMNPYRAELLDTNSIWPYTVIASEDWEWFQPLLSNDCPYPEWLV